MKSLIELYKSLQASVGMVSDHQGFVGTVLPGGDTSKPYIIDGKRVVLPLPEQLNEPDWSGRIGFHPLLQKVQEGESKVVEKFRERMNAYSDFMTGALFLNIAKLASEKEKHMALDPTQAAYLGPFADGDEKFFKFMTSLVSTSRTNKKNLEFVRISLLRGRQWQGKKRARVAVLHFPLYEAMPTDGKGTTILGHKLRQADVRMIRAMYEYLFPGINEKEVWEVPSDSLIAASMESLMLLYAKYIEQHNRAVVILGDQIEAGSDLLIVNDWEEDMTKLPEYLPEIRKIPWLEGATPSRVEVSAAPQSIAMPTTQARQYVAPSSTPVLSADAIPSTVVLNQPQAMQPTTPPPPPRFKIGLPLNTNAADTTERQITNEQAHQPTIAYQRNSNTVGSSYHEPQPVQKQVQSQYMAQPIQQPQAPQALAVPASARLINNQLYIPVEASGVATIPQNAVLVDNKVYVPLGGNTTAPGMMPGAVMPGNNMLNRGNALPGMGHAPITDPSQVPGLTPEEVNYYRSNPVMFHNYLSQLQQTGAAQVQQAAAARQNSVPRYLRNAVEQAQQTQFSSNRSFFNR